VREFIFKTPLSPRGTRSRKWPEVAAQIDGRVRRTNPCVSAAIYESERELLVYAAGGARGEVCEKSGPVAGTMSSGSGKEAIGFSKETDGATSNCTGVWWPKWQ